MKRQIAFIVGPPRSGTTLVQSILASHSAISTLPETHFFEDLVPVLGSKAFQDNSQVTEQTLQLAQKAIQKSGFSLALKPEQSYHMTVRELFERMLDQYTDLDATLLVEKTPGHIRFLREIQALVPSAKIIAVIRHPVESIASMKNQRPISVNDHRLNYLTSFRFLSAHWRSHAWPLLETNSQSNCFTLRYEQLIAHPSKLVRLLCTYLDIEYEPQMLTMFGSTASGFVNLNVEPWKQSNLEDKLRDNRFKWRRRLSQRQVWLIEELTAKELFQLGYERTSRPNLLDRSIAMIEDRLMESLRQSHLEKCIRCTVRQVSSARTRAVSSK